MRRDSWLPLLLLLTACGSREDDSLPAACECVDGDACGPELCAAIERVAGVVADEAALDCALTALRDRTPGRLRWSDREDAAAFGVIHRLWIVADGQAVHTTSRAEDVAPICTSEGPTVTGALGPADEFAACLAEPAASARFDCLDAAATAFDEALECAPQKSVCDE